MEPNKKEPVDAMKLIKSLIDVIQASFATAWKAVLLLGGAVLIAYCYLESIVPEGLSLGDAFFLASAAFSFTCIALIGIGFGQRSVCRTPGRASADGCPRVASGTGPRVSSPQRRTMSPPSPHIVRKRAASVEKDRIHQLQTQQPMPVAR